MSIEYPELVVPIEGNKTGYWEYNLVTNKWLCSPEIFSICGLDVREFSDDAPAFLKLIPDQAELRIKSEMEISRKTGKGFSIGHKMFRTNGQKINVEMVASCHSNADGAVEEFYGTLTWLKHIEEKEDTHHSGNPGFLEPRVKRGYWNYDLDKRLIRFSAGATKILGISSDSLTLETLANEIGTSELSSNVIKSLFSAKHEVSSFSNIEIIESDDNKKTISFELNKFRFKDGLIVSGSISEVAENQPEQVAKVVDVDVAANDCKTYSDLYSMNKSLLNAKDNNLDAVTGLLNRSRFLEEIQSFLSTIKPEEGNVIAFTLIDIDYFKVVNETVGYQGGDSLLKELANIIEEQVSGQGISGRLGNDEFGILFFPDAPTSQRILLERIHRCFDELSFCYSGEKFQTTLSSSLVILDEGDALPALLKKSEIACEMAMEKGGNRIEIFKADCYLADDLRFLSKLKKALKHEKVLLFAQPIVPIKDVRPLNAYELLIRVEDEQGEITLPGKYLSVAEEYNLSLQVDLWVIDTYFKFLQDNPAELEALDVCFINLSAISLVSDRFLDHVIYLLGKTKIPGEKICFEITETAVVTNIKKAQDVMQSLQWLGVKFAIDDFGSGMSSFGYIKDLSVDFVKIDGDFVTRIDTDPMERELFRLMVEAGKIFGRGIIAEKVENAQVLEAIKQIGVDYAQGYYLGEPINVKDYVKNMNSKIDQDQIFKIG